MLNGEEYRIEEDGYITGRSCERREEVRKNKGKE